MNLFGSNSRTWNVLPAVLTTWSNLLSTRGNETEYKLYKQQAKEYIQTARENADLIRSKGEIALRNLEYKDKLERGADIATLGAAGGNMSGTSLDVLVQKEKVRKMDEVTLKANYSNQAMLEIVNGYRQAGNTYGTLAAKANADKWGVWASILKGVEAYVGLQVRDAKIEKATAEKAKQTKQSYEIQKQGLREYYYGAPVSQALNTYSESNYDTYSFIPKNYEIPDSLNFLDSSSENSSLSLFSEQNSNSGRIIG